MDFQNADIKEEKDTENVKLEEIDMITYKYRNEH